MRTVDQITNLIFQTFWLHSFNLMFAIYVMMKLLEVLNVSWTFEESYAKKNDQSKSRFDNIYTLLKLYNPISSRERDWLRTFSVCYLCTRFRSKWCINSAFRFPISPKKIQGTPFSPHYAIFKHTKGGIFKSCFWVLKLWIWLLRVYGNHIQWKISAHMGGGAELPWHACTVSRAENEVN